MSSQTTFKTAGATSKHVDLQLVQKAAATSPGDPITGLAFNTSSLVCWYRLGATGTLTQITLATQTVTGAYSSGGFVEISSANAPGGYRFDIPNACIATAGECNIWFSGAANLAVHELKIIVTAVDLFDAVRGGLTALPNVASGSAGALPTTGTGANQLNVSGGRADSNQVAIGGYVYPTGTIQSATNTTATLASGTTQSQCAPGDILAPTSNTGAGQFAFVASLDITDPTHPVATLGPTGFQWPFVNVNNTTGYTIIKQGGGAPASLDEISPVVWTSAGVPREVSSAANITGSGLAIPMSAAGNAKADVEEVGAVALVGGRVPANVTAMANGVIATGTLADALLTAAKFAPNAIGASQLATDAVTEIRDAIFAQPVEGLITLLQSLRGYNSMLFAKCSGLETNAPGYRDLADTKNRVTGIVDQYGNRLTVNLDLN